MLKIDKLDEKAFALQRDDEQRHVYLEPFSAVSSEDVIVIRSQVGSDRYVQRFSEVIVDGVIYGSAEETVRSLAFLGNFKRGGGSPSPTPADGKTHVYGVLTPLTGYSLPIRLSIEGNATIRVDWGNGTFTDTSSATSDLTAPYTGPLDYHITIERISGNGTYIIGGLTQGRSLQGSAAGYRQAATKVFFGENVSIGGYALYNHQSIRSLTLPGGITAIEAYSLNSLRSLLSIVIPASVERIAVQAFHSSYALNEIILMSEAPPELEDVNAFANGTTIRKYYVPDGSVSAYQAAPIWETFANQIYPISERS